MIDNAVIERLWHFMYDAGNVGVIVGVGIILYGVLTSD